MVRDWLWCQNPYLTNYTGFASDPVQNLSEISQILNTEILYETCSKNIKFVRFYLKSVFNIFIFGQKINIGIDSGYVNK